MAHIISIFGGASPKPGTPAYEDARQLGTLLAQAGYTIATGGYGGVMEAASRGAREAGGHVIGVTCQRIQDWRGLTTNPWVAEEIKFPSLRERLYHLVEFCDVAIALSGGVGTLSEVALTWSLIQTQEIAAKPLIVVGRVWAETLTAFLREAESYVHHEDTHLLKMVATIDDAVKVISKQ